MTVYVAETLEEIKRAARTEPPRWNTILELAMELEIFVHDDFERDAIQRLKGATMPHQAIEAAEEIGKLLLGQWPRTV
jgi:hypothetical protein